MEKINYIPTKYLQFHPYRGLVIAFGYTDEEGKEDGNVRIGRIAEWDYTNKDTSDVVNEFYIDVCLKAFEERKKVVGKLCDDGTAFADIFLDSNIIHISNYDKNRSE